MQMTTPTLISTLKKRLKSTPMPHISGIKAGRVSAVVSAGWVEWEKTVFLSGGEFLVG